MKKIKSIILLIGLFLIALISVLFVFSNNIKNIKLRNKTKEIINYVYKLDSNEYYYKYGVLYDLNNNIITTDYYIDGVGKFIKDDYGNVEASLTLEDRCIYKTYLGKVKVDTECNYIKDIKPVISKNNSQISFKFDYEIVSYKLSRQRDYSGDFIKLNSNSLILNLYDQGVYYIWFKDSYGNLSSSIEFNINCLNAQNSEYYKGMLYCAGSTLTIDDYTWIVVSDINEEITLMRLESLDNSMSHTKGNNEYRWSKSLINEYLNSKYINTLSDDLKDSLVSIKICDDESGNNGCDSNDGCGGYKKSTIEEYEWSCEKYTTSKVRLISYDEYSNLYDRLSDKSLIYGNYWTINSYKINKTGISITNNGEVFVNEDTVNELEVKPVITLKR